MASSDTTSVRKLNGNGSTGRQPDTSPVFHAIHLDEPEDVEPREPGAPGDRAMASEKRSAEVRRARSAASIWATAATFRATRGSRRAAVEIREGRIAYEWAGAGRFRPAPP